MVTASWSPGPSMSGPAPTFVTQSEECGHEQERS